MITSMSTCTCKLFRCLHLSQVQVFEHDAMLRLCVRYTWNVLICILLNLNANARLMNAENKHSRENCTCCILCVHNIPVCELVHSATWYKTIVGMQAAKLRFHCSSKLHLYFSAAGAADNITVSLCWPRCVQNFRWATTPRLTVGSVIISNSMFDLNEPIVCQLLPRTKLWQDWCWAQKLPAWD